ncbi:MAG: flagellar basal body L-ring protein FlgH [Planctomycetes bacterium]|nr:flagellar basal body L-ring protein FlgH [Planctomycetota bacterium]
MRTLFLALVVSFLGVPGVFAQGHDQGPRSSSLYEADERLRPPSYDAKPRANQSLYSDIVTDPKEFKKHDLITVLILEKSRSSVRANTRVDKQTQLEIDLDQWIRFRRGDHTSQHQVDDSDNPFSRYTLEAANGGGALPGVDFESQYQRSNRGQTDRTGQLLEKVTAEVVKVLPNRTLVIEARKERRVNDETETLLLTGIIRADDVTSQNTIESEKIARLSIEYTGEGTVDDAQKAGWLARAWEWLYPF